MTSRLSVISALGALACAPSADAHHSFSAIFDGSRTVAVEGVVTEFRLVNPHALATLESRDAAGAPVIWTIEFDGRLNLAGAGWNDDTLRIGERVVVSGNPSRSDTPRLWFLGLTRSDGSELIKPSTLRIDAIEEERRRRAAQRSEQD